jgi:hydroxymethylglutaryl-CoA reductase (NADPH)
MFISPAMLERVYMRGSLKNTASGYEFTLKNVVEGGSMAGIKSITVDSADVPITSVTLRMDDKERRAEEVNYRTPFYLRFNAEVSVCISGQPLVAGAHDIVLVINVSEIGQLQFTIQDEV